MNCVEKAGGAHNIRNQWNETNRNQSNSYAGQNIDRTVVPVLASSTIENSHQYANNNQVMVSSSVPNSGHFYQSSTFAPSHQQFYEQKTATVVPPPISPPPLFTSSRVHNQVLTSEVRRSPIVTTNYVQRPVNVFASRTVTEPVYPVTPKFQE